jgi:hypothetical protein
MRSSELWIPLQIRRVVKEGRVGLGKCRHFLIKARVCFAFDQQVSSGKTHREGTAAALWLPTAERKTGMVLMRMEDRLPVVAAKDHVVQTTLDLDPRLSCY